MCTIKSHWYSKYCIIKIVSIILLYIDVSKCYILYLLFIRNIIPFKVRYTHASMSILYSVLMYSYYYYIYVLIYQNITSSYNQESIWVFLQGVSPAFGFNRSRRLICVSGYL